MTRWDIDFSLALHNRTGKYHIGRELLDELGARFERTWYWRVPLSSVPTGTAARLIGRMMGAEHRARGMALLPAGGGLRPGRPLLHLDPLTVLHCRLAETDGVLCHDVGPITHPDLFDPAVTGLYDRAYRRIVDGRPRVIFASAASRDAFISLYGEWGRFEVIYPPLRIALDGAGAAAPPDISAPFLLTVGSIGARKNQRAMIEAFAASGLAGRGISYILCGAREPGAEAVEALARRTAGVRLLSYVSDRELNWLYGNASGFALVSRLEGFGMPVAEAILHGLVPLVTEASVLQEVAGPDALAAPHDDIAAIADAMRRLIDMPAAESMRRRAALQASLGRFSRQAFVESWSRFLSGPAA